MSPVKKLMLLVLGTLSFTLAMPSNDAHAARIPIFYQTGEEIFVAGDGTIPAPFTEAKALAGTQAGFRCNVFGVFGAMISVSSCTPVAFKGASYIEDEKLGAALLAAHPESTMQMGMWQRYGRIPLGLALVLFVGLGAYGHFKGDDEEEEQVAQAPGQQPGQYAGQQPGQQPAQQPAQHAGYQHAQHPGQHPHPH